MMGNINVTKGHCLECEQEFTYVRYKVDKNYCSTSCRGRYYYRTKGTYSQRSRRTKMSEEEWKEYKREYDKEYHKRYYQLNRNSILERERQRRNTEAYRAYMRGRYYRPYRDVRVDLPDLAHGYSGDAFDSVRAIVGPPPDSSAPWFDDWAEKMGTAILAAAEGRDVREALKEYRKSEFIPKYRTVRLGEFKQEDAFKLDKILATENLTENEALAKITAAEAPSRKEKFSMGSSTVKFGKGYNKSRTAPSRRRGYKPWQDRPGHRRSA